MNTVRRSDPAPTFRFLAERVSQVAAAAGVTIRPYRDPELPLLRTLPPADQRKLTAELERYLFVCERTVRAGYAPTGSSRFLWFALRTMGFLPPENLFDFVRDDQVVMINDPQHRQIFRNFAFFELCSYTLEELYSCPWPTLYHSNIGYNEDLKLASLALTSELGRVIRSTTPKHISLEVASAFHYEIDFQVAFFAGVKDRLTSTAGGYLTLSQGALRRVREGHAPAQKAGSLTQG